MKTPPFALAPLEAIPAGTCVIYRMNNAFNVAVALKPEGTSVGIVDLYRYGSQLPNTVGKLVMLPSSSGNWGLTIGDAEVDFDPADISDLNAWKPGALVIDGTGFWVLAENTAERRPGQLAMANLQDGSWVAADAHAQKKSVFGKWRLVRRLANQVQEICRIEI
jgi:hypothetical protein